MDILRKTAQPSPMAESMTPPASDVADISAPPERLADPRSVHRQADAFTPASFGGLSYRQGWQIQGFPADVVALSTVLARRADYTMDTLVGFSRRGAEAADSLGFSGVPGHAKTRLTRALERAPGMRAATLVRERSVQRLEEFSQELKGLQNDRAGIRRLIGHTAAEHVSSVHLEGMLAAMGVPPGERGEHVLRMQRLHQDTPRLAAFMAGEDAGMGDIVDVVQRNIPNARRAVASLQEDLKKERLDVRSFLSSSEFGGIREEVLRDQPPHLQRAVRQSARRVASDVARETYAASIVTAGFEGLAAFVCGPAGWTVGAASSVKSVGEARRLQARAEVLTGAGIAERSHASGASDALAREIFSGVTGLLPSPPIHGVSALLGAE